jgi:hypothetical protein
MLISLSGEFLQELGSPTNNTSYDAEKKNCLPHILLVLSRTDLALDGVPTEARMITTLRFYYCCLLVCPSNDETEPASSFTRTKPIGPILHRFKQHFILIPRGRVSRMRLLQV